jgi:outer membrane protein assembly factor BamB
MRLRAGIGQTLRSLAAALVAAGCSGLRIDAPPPIEADDWPTAARTPARAGMTPERLVPPLAEAWSSDLKGGTGATALAVADSVIFTATLRGDLQAFNVRTGRSLGRISLGSALTGAPALSGPRVIVPVAAGPSGLAAFDLADGSVAWRAVPGDVESAPLLLGDRVVAGTTTGLLVCVSAARGDTLWTWQLPANRLLKGIRGAPASDSLRIVVAAEDGSVSAVRAENGALIWRHTGPASFATGPLLEDSVVIACDVAGGVVALGAGAGAVLWRAHAGAAVYASPAAADGLVLVGTSGGRVHAFRLADGTTAWSTATGEAIAAAPVVAGRVVYAGTLGKRLLALSLPDGRMLWDTELGGRVRAQPVVAQGMLFVTTDERVLTAFREATP